MIVNHYETKEDWMQGRLACVTGSKLSDIHAPRGGRKIGYYQLIADRLVLEGESTSSSSERGQELEAEAIEVLGKELGIKFITDLVIWKDELNPYLAFSPDGYTKDLKQGAEAKCLGTARHLQIALENRLPNDYHLQAIQAFVVNPDLEYHHVISYDPRVTAKPFHIITFNRKDLHDEITYYREYETQLLADVEDVVAQLAF